MCQPMICVSYQRKNCENILVSVIGGKCFNVLPIVKVFPTALSDSSQASLSILMKWSPQYLIQ